jgi:hypothetical protein
VSSFNLIVDNYTGNEEEGGNQNSKAENAKTVKGKMREAKRYSICV